MDSEKMSAATPTPSVDDMYIAAQWLEVHEGAEDAESCRRVSEWLKAQGAAKELREAARAAGVPVAKARAAIAKRAAGQ